jgi:hypothetical protein
MKNLYYTTEKLEELKRLYSTLPIDAEGNIGEVVYQSAQVRSDILKLIADVQRLRRALEDIDIHIRSTGDPVPYIIETLKNTLPEYSGWWSIGE